MTRVDMSYRTPPSISPRVADVRFISRSADGKSLVTGWERPVRWSLETGGETARAQQNFAVSPGLRLTAPPSDMAATADGRRILLAQASGVNQWMPADETFSRLAPKLVAAFVMMAVLALLGYKRQEFFLSSGPHRKLWIGSGVVAALVMGLTMIVYLQTTAAEAKGAAGAIRYLPLALVLAAMNSFAEEMLYRGVLLGPLLRQVTTNQAISMTAVLFGIAHYHGTPSGFPGMGLTFIAGWVFGLAMVETRSILLPWLLHFVPDAVIYVTSALKN